jgi:predicted membrane protein
MAAAGIATGMTTMLCIIPGRQSVAAGIAAGLTIAIIGLLLFAVSFRRDTEASFSRMIRDHILWALLFRIPLMLGIFAATIILIKINAIGILIGVTFGALAIGISAFVKFLSAVRRKSPV